MLMIMTLLCLKQKDLESTPTSSIKVQVQGKIKKY